MFIFLIQILFPMQCEPFENTQKGKEQTNIKEKKKSFKIKFVC